MATAVLGDRSLFPDLPCTAYMAHAAISPLSAPVRARVDEVLDAYASGGLAGFGHCVPLLKEARERLSTLIGAGPDEIAFVSNTTHGVIDIAFGIKWRAGDRVVLFEGEFPANVTPWQRAADTFGLELVWLPLDAFQRSHDEGLARLETELERGVRLVAVSAVQYKTGLRMPLEAMAAKCRAHDAELFVDAIQALGATPLDVGCGIDYLSTGSHKHLMGPEGAGMVYVARRRASTLEPRLAGWLSHERAGDFLTGDRPLLRYDKELQPGARAFEIGTQNALGLCALGVSVGLIQGLGVDGIHQHVNHYLDRLEPELVERGFRSFRSNVLDARSTLLSVAAPEGVLLTRLSAALSREGVVCNTPDGLLRFSPHWPNHADEVPRVLDAVDRVLAAVVG